MLSLSAGHRHWGRSTLLDLGALRLASAGGSLNSATRLRGVSPVVTLSILELEAQAEDSNDDLANGHEAPDRGLLVEIVSDEHGEQRASSEENEAVNPHVPRPHSEVGSEHHEEVDAVARHDVGRSMEREAPSEMVLAPESAALVATDPLSVGPSELVSISEEDPATEHHAAHDESQATDQLHLSLLLLVLDEGTAKEVSEIRLEADVEKAEDGQELVCFTLTVPDPKELEELECLHGYEVPGASKHGFVPSRPVSPQAD